MSPNPNHVICGLLLLAALALAACGSDSTGTPDAIASCVPSAPAPTYSELFTKYFAPGTPGHCANNGCHGGPSFYIWECGLTKDSCYRGMSSAMARLIDTQNPAASQIGDPKSSPISWVNPGGQMPYDTPGAFPEGRDAILAWVAACAQNN